ncbi:hypothetical protein ScPMuIL_011610 [Solemya velum]
MTRHRRQRWWTGWIIIITQFLALTDGIYQLVAPSMFVAFSGSLRVNYSIPSNVSLPNAFVKVLAVVDNVHLPVTTHGLAMRARGHLEFTCGLIDFATQYRLELHTYVDGPILTTTSLEVKWPNIRLEIPTNHTAQTSPIDLIITSEAKCDPLFHKETFYLDLEYLGMGQEAELFSLNRMPRVIYNYRFHNLSAPVTKCPSNDDKIRIFMLQREVLGSFAAPVHRKYISERKVDMDVTFMNYNCSQFNASSTGYCFTYVSVSSNGAVMEQDRRCISAHPDSAMPIDGGWSAWSTWGACTVTCGTGKRNRFRMCNKPKPSRGGQFCPGKPVQWRLCHTDCPDTIPRSPLRQPLVNTKCSCGCELNGESGEIIASGRCDGLSSWVISVRFGVRIKLNFVYFDLFESRQWVKIRDGDTEKDVLLAFNSGQNALSEIVSSSNKMFVQFMTKPSININISSAGTEPEREFPSTENLDNPNSSPSVTTEKTNFWISNPTRPIHVYGFIAKYSVYDAAVAVEQKPMPMVNAARKIEWENTVTILGIGLCAIIVIAAISFVFYNRLANKRKPKYAMAAQEDTPTHVARSTSMHSSPSRESACGGVEIDQDMERPLTGNSKRKDSILSRGPSNSSKTSNSYKKIRTRADIESGGNSHSPHEYTPLQSPLVASFATDGNGLEVNGKSSPRIRTKHPRSPKIHPSPRMSRPSNPSTPLSPPETKHGVG